MPARSTPQLPKCFAACAGDLADANENATRAAADAMAKENFFIVFTYKKTRKPSGRAGHTRYRFNPALQHVFCCHRTNLPLLKRADPYADTARRGLPVPFKHSGGAGRYLAE